VIEGGAAIAEQIVVAGEGLVPRFGRIDVHHGQLVTVARRALQNDAAGTHDLAVPPRASVPMRLHVMAKMRFSRQRTGMESGQFGKTKLDG